MAATLNTGILVLCFAVVVSVPPPPPVPSDPSDIGNVAGWEGMESNTPPAGFDPRTTTPGLDPNTVTPGTVPPEGGRGTGPGEPIYQPDTNQTGFAEMTIVTTQVPTDIVGTEAEAGVASSNDSIADIMAAEGSMSSDFSNQNMTKDTANVQDGVLGQDTINEAVEVPQMGDNLALNVPPPPQPDISGQEMMPQVDIQITDQGTSAGEVGSTVSVASAQEHLPPVVKSPQLSVQPHEHFQGTETAAFIERPSPLSSEIKVQLGSLGSSSDAGVPIAYGLSNQINGIKQASVASSSTRGTGSFISGEPSGDVNLNTISLDKTSLLSGGGMVDTSRTGAAGGFRIPADVFLEDPKYNVKMGTMGNTLSMNTGKSIESQSSGVVIEGMANVPQYTVVDKTGADISPIEKQSTSGIEHTTGSLLPVERTETTTYPITAHAPVRDETITQTVSGGDLFTQGEAQVGAIGSGLVDVTSDTSSLSDMNYTSAVDLSTALAGDQTKITQPMSTPDKITEYNLTETDSMSQGDILRVQTISTQYTEAPYNETAIAVEGGIVDQTHETKGAVDAWAPGGLIIGDSFETGVSDQSGQMTGIVHDTNTTMDQLPPPGTEQTDPGINVPSPFERIPPAVEVAVDVPKDIDIVSSVSTSRPEIFTTPQPPTIRTVYPVDVVSDITSSSHIPVSYTPPRRDPFADGGPVISADPIVSGSTFTDVSQPVTDKSFEAPQVTKTTTIVAEIPTDKYSDTVPVISKVTTTQSTFDQTVELTSVLADSTPSPQPVEGIMDQEITDQPRTSPTFTTGAETTVVTTPIVTDVVTTQKPQPISTSDTTIVGRQTTASQAPEQEIKVQIPKEITIKIDPSVTGDSAPQLTRDRSPPTEVQPPQIQPNASRQLTRTTQEDQESVGPALESLCVNSVFIDAIGYNTYPGFCNKVVQCFQYQGRHVAVLRDCPAGYFWHHEQALCRQPAEVPCYDDPCLNFGVYTYNRTGGCASFYTCEYGISIPTCCQRGFRFNGVDCVPDATCTDPCITPQELESQLRYAACKFLPDEHNPYGYITMEHNGLRIRACPRGTVFSARQCGCTRVRGQAGRRRMQSCSPQFFMNFNRGFQELSGSNMASQSDNVVINTGAAEFDGTGRITIWGYMDRDLGDKFAIRLRFKVNGNKNGYQSIVSNCGMTGAPTVEIALHNGQLRFLAKSKEFDETTIVNKAIDPYRWNEAFYLYDGLTFRAGVNGDIEQVPLGGYLEKKSNPFLIGGCPRPDTGFHGMIDSIAIYTNCIPRDLFASGR